MMGDSVEHVISYWVAFQKFQSPALGGFAVLSHWLPFLFFSIYSGALADRFDSRRIIHIGMLLFMFVSAAWAYLFYSDILEIWHAQLLLVLHGFASVLWIPAGQVLVHNVVGKQDLASAVRLNATGRYLGFLLGPAVGGAILIALGPVIGMLVNVAAYLPMLLWLWKGPRANLAPPTSQLPLRGLADVMTTARAVANNPTLFGMILLTVGLGAAQTSIHWSLALSAALLLVLALGFLVYFTYTSRIRVRTDI